MAVTAVHDVNDYKLTLLKDIFSNEKIVRVLDSQQFKDKDSPFNPEEPEALIYKNLFPYLKVIDTQMIADAYILLAVDILDINKVNSTFANYRIKLRIVVHEDRMRMKDFNGTRLDYLYGLLAEEFDGSYKFGFDVLELNTRIEDVYNEDYHFIDMIFYTKDLKVSAAQKVGKLGNVGGSG